MILVPGNAAQDSAHLLLHLGVPGTERDAEDAGVGLRLVSMSTTAMIGIGLSAIPTASGSDPPMALPITLLERFHCLHRVALHRLALLSPEGFISHSDKEIAAAHAVLTQAEDTKVIGSRHHLPATFT